jgi:transcriptional regulator with XRE-family HTH domain
MKLSLFVKNYRENKSLTLDRLSKKSNLSKGFLSRLEQGDFDQKNISLETIIKLSAGFDIKVKDILDFLNVIEQDKPSSLKVYLREKYKIISEVDVNVIEGVIKSFSENKQ